MSARTDVVFAASSGIGCSLARRLHGEHMLDPVPRGLTGQIPGVGGDPHTVWVRR